MIHYPKHKLMYSLKFRRRRVKSKAGQKQNHVQSLQDKLIKAFKKLSNNFTAVYKALNFI